MEDPVYCLAERTGNKTGPLPCLLIDSKLKATCLFRFVLIIGGFSELGLLLVVDRGKFILRVLAINRNNKLVTWNKIIFPK